MQKKDENQNDKEKLIAGQTNYLADPNFDTALKG